MRTTFSCAGGFTPAPALDSGAEIRERIRFSEETFRISFSLYFGIIGGLVNLLFYFARIPSRCSFWAKVATSRKLPSISVRGGEF